MTEEAQAVMAAKNYYEIFGVANSSQFDETLVRKAYRKLALKLVRYWVPGMNRRPLG